MISLKKIDLSDIEYLDSVRQVFTDGWNANMLKDAFSGGNFHGYIAQSEGKNGTEKVGFITYTLGLDFADIECVFVAEKFRKQGIANLLVSSVVDKLSEQTEKILLEVRESNIPAINLYKKHGFNLLSVRKKYYFDGENALIMCREK